MSQVFDFEIRERITSPHQLVRIPGNNQGYAVYIIPFTRTGETIVQKDYAYGEQRLQKFKFFGGGVSKADLTTGDLTRDEETLSIKDVFKTTAIRELYEELANHGSKLQNDISFDEVKFDFSNSSKIIWKMSYKRIYMFVEVGYDILLKYQQRFYIDTERLKTFPVDEKGFERGSGIETLEVRLININPNTVISDEFTQWTFNLITYVFDNTSDFVESVNGSQPKNRNRIHQRQNYTTTSTSTRVATRVAVSATAPVEAPTNAPAVPVAAPVAAPVATPVPQESGQVKKVVYKPGMFRELKNLQNPKN